LRQKPEVRAPEETNPRGLPRANGAGKSNEGQRRRRRPKGGPARAANLERRKASAGAHTEAKIRADAANYDGWPSLREGLLQDSLLGESLAGPLLRTIVSPHRVYAICFARSNVGLGCYDDERACVWAAGAYLLPSPTTSSIRGCAKGPPALPRRAVRALVRASSPDAAAFGSSCRAK